jgi:UDP-N-acetylglucosamine 2-epimerase (non-hydrolysing)
MSKLFSRLDQEFDHILIHTGQHYDILLKDIFFKELSIRQPDYTWDIGINSSDHLEQFSNLILKVKANQDLLKSAGMVLFLGDSNSVLASVPLKKLGIKVGHIEAGMRSYDKRMLEEINRITCDHNSDVHFCYHNSYKNNLFKEGLNKSVHLVGNTIVEPVRDLLPEITSKPKQDCHILMDIHRPENFLYPERLANIVAYANYYADKLDLPVYLLNFTRMINKLREFKINLYDVKVVDQMGFKEYLTEAYHSKFVISDSGTAQEELAMLGTPLLVPREFTERPESLFHRCSKMLDANQFSKEEAEKKLKELDELTFDTSWLGMGNTSLLITSILRGEL